jgi:hypothetical protein
MKWHQRNNGNGVMAAGENGSAYQENGNVINRRKWRIIARKSKMK